MKIDHLVTSVRCKSNLLSSKTNFPFMSENELGITTPWFTACLVVTLVTIVLKWDVYKAASKICLSISTNRKVCS